MNQRQGFQAPTGDLTTPLGNLVQNVANDENNGAAVAQLVDYGNINQNGLQNPLITERMLIDPTERGFQFCKMTLYYMVKYATPVSELSPLNPIRARMLGLISSIGFYMQFCCNRSREYLSGNSRPNIRGTFDGDNLANSISIMRRTELSADQIVGSDFRPKKKKDEQLDMKTVDKFLSLSFVKYNPKRDTLGAMGFRRLQSSYRTLGEVCATRANELFASATPVKMKTTEYSAAASRDSVRHANFTGHPAQHNGCNDKFVLLREYLFEYSRISRGLGADVKIDMNRIQFGDDPKLVFAFNVVKARREHSFWNLCKNDFVQFGTNEEHNIRPNDIQHLGTYETRLEQKLDNLIRNYIANRA